MTRNTLTTQTKLFKTANVINTLPKWRYDLGKYNPNGKGREMITDVPVWYESRSDNHGTFIVLFCVDEEKLATDAQRSDYEKLLTYWRCNG